jgi:hypothetical protein
MAQDLIGGTIAAGGLQGFVVKVLGQFGNVAVEPRQDLLAMRMPDRHATDAGTDDAERRLMQEERDGFARRGAGALCQGTERDRVMPFRISLRSPPGERGRG